jgi:peptidoglycan hydrolase-like protein with peptidoglycan-binding domain
MYEGRYRRQAVPNHRGDRPSRVHGRPDRVALWAAFVALVALVAAATSAATADADSGTGGTGTVADCQDLSFGDRALQLGDCGDDVKTLNWVLSTEPSAADVSLGEEFDEPTDVAVRELQAGAGLNETGVVNDRTRRRIKSGMGRQKASWYGPGFYGNDTACGKRLRRTTIGVAHKRLPCGTKVTFNKGGRWLRARVIDRGPYSKGVRWDLTEAAAQELGLEYTESVRAAAIVEPEK